MFSSRSSKKRKSLQDQQIMVKAAADTKRRQDELNARMQLEHNRLRESALQGVPEKEQRHVFPEDTYSLVDRMDSHQKGRKVKYAVISTAPVADQSGALSWLRGFKPRNEKANALLDNIPPLNIQGEFACVDLEKAIRNTMSTEMKEYCLIAEVFVHYVPLIPFQSNSQAVDICIRDDRYMEPRIVRQARISGNVSYNILMSMDYCFLTSDLRDFKLTFGSHQKSLKEGKVWGMAKVIVGLSFFDMAIKNNVRETMAVIQWADSDLHDYVADPTKVDMLVTAEGYRRLKERYNSGELENTTEAEDDLMGMVTAATVIAGTRDTQKVGSNQIASLMKSKARSDEFDKDMSQASARAFLPKPIMSNDLGKSEEGVKKSQRFKSPPPSVFKYEDSTRSSTISMSRVYEEGMPIPPRGEDKRELEDLVSSSVVDDGIKFGDHGIASKNHSRQASVEDVEEEVFLSNMIPN